MKKIIAVAAISVFIISCNDTGSTKTESAADSSKTGNSGSTDTSKNAMGKDTSMNSMSSSPAMASTSKAEGSMTMKDGKMMVMKDGKWVLMDQIMTCTDGCHVTPLGQVIMKGKSMMMTEGMTIDKDGHMTDDKGKMMDNMMMSSDKKDSMKK